MKFILLLVVSAMSLSAFAGSINLYDIEGADQYNSVELEYDVSHKPSIVIKASRNQGIPGHPETWVDFYIAYPKALKYDGRALTVTVDRKVTTCAVMNGDEIKDTGDCRLMTDVVGNTLRVSLETK